MAVDRTDADASANIGVLGPPVRFTAIVTSLANATALAPGRYVLSVETGAVRVRGPTTRVRALAVDGSGHRIVAGGTFALYIGTEDAEAFLGVIRDTADSVVTVAPFDRDTAERAYTTALPAWAA